MITRLTKGLLEQEKSDLKQSMAASNIYRKRVKTLIEEDNAAIVNSMTKDANFTSPNWELIQVDRLAQIKCNERLIKLLEL